jgi:hypothetical protein
MILVPKQFGRMGFESLRTFNYAIFGKQACKLLTNIDTHITKLSKAKYSIDSVFFNASIEYNPSHVYSRVFRVQSLSSKEDANGALTR